MTSSGEGRTNQIFFLFFSLCYVRCNTRYYVDGEETPSIAFQPALMCGQAFPDRIKPTDMYSAGGMCGKNAAVGGWFNTFPVPFSKTILVLARGQQSGCAGGYINIRHVYVMD